MHVLRSKDVSQVYFDVVSHMAIVVNKIIRPIAACVVPHMRFSPLSFAQEGEQSAVKPGYCVFTLLTVRLSTGGKAEMVN